LVRSLNDCRERLGANAVKIESADSLAFMRRGIPASYEIVFVDPPFDANLFESALSAAEPLVVSGGFIYLESDRAFDDAAVASFGLTIYRHARAGAVHFHLLQRKADSHAA